MEVWSLWPWPEGQSGQTHVSSAICSPPLSPFSPASYLRPALPFHSPGLGVGVCSWWLWP